MPFSAILLVFKFLMFSFLQVCKFTDSQVHNSIDCPYFYGLSVKIIDLLHLINIGMNITYQMNTVLSEICDAVTPRLSGAVGSMMFSHSDLISRWAGIVFESWYRFSHFSFLFCYVSHISNIFPLDCLTDV